ncbi:unnamed protein product [Urochloa humidicola]
MAEENTRGPEQPWGAALTTARLRPRSAAWEHFVRSTDAQGNDRAQCKYCGKLLRGAHLRIGYINYLQRHYNNCKERNATTVAVDSDVVPQDTHTVAVIVNAVPQEVQPLILVATSTSQPVGEEIQPLVLVATNTSQPDEATPQGTGCVVKLINKLIPALVAETCTGIVVKFTPAEADQIEEQQKRCAAYSQKALAFAVTTFFAYVGAHSDSSTRTAFFKIAMTAFFLAVPTDLISVTRPPKWGSLLTYLSWFLLVLVSYLLLISFNKNYGYAILPVPIPLVIALLQLNLRPGAWQRCSRPVEAGHDANTEGIALRTLKTDIEAGQYVHTEDEAVPAANANNEAGQDVNAEDEAVSAANTNNEADEYLDSIFNLSAGVVNFGGLVSMISGHYMGGLDKLVGFFFFFTIVLGLYLMMVTTVRTVPLTLHARNLSYLLEFLLVSTLITTLIYKVPNSGSDSHV